MFTRTTRAKRNIATVALAALVGSLLALSTPAGAGQSTAATETRLGGANRYATAAAVAQDDAWGTPANDTIVVVNGDDDRFADGLTAAALGFRVLLVKTDSIPAETSAAIAALEAAPGGANPDGVGEIYIVGGTGVVSAEVREQLDDLNGSGDGVTRLAGADRYETALAVAAVVDPAAVNKVDVILATGLDFPDALAAGPLAASTASPILLNAGDSLRADVKSYISGATGTVYIVGGDAAVPETVESELTAMGKTVVRLEGATREETAIAIAGQTAKTAGKGDESVLLVNRNSAADAMAAGPFANQVDGSIMLVSDTVSSAVADWHVSNCATLGETNANAGVYAMGGEAVVSASVVSTSVGATKCAAVTYTATVANSDLKQAVYGIAQAIDGGAADSRVSGANGVKLTAVAGSAADGANGNGWTISVSDGTTASASADVAARTLTVVIPIPDNNGAADATKTDLSQADFVATWIAIGGDATAYFTPSVTTTTGAPVSYIHDTGNDPLSVSTTPLTNGSQDQTIVVTFNQAVDNTEAVADATEVVLTTGAFVITATSGAVTPAVISPLVNTPGGSNVYTMIFSDLTDRADVADVGDDMVIDNGAGVADAWSTVNGNPVPVAAVKLTAG